MRRDVTDEPFLPVVAAALLRFNLLINGGDGSFGNCGFGNGDGGNGVGGCGDGICGDGGCGNCDCGNGDGGSCGNGGDALTVVVAVTVVVATGVDQSWVGAPTLHELFATCDLQCRHRNQKKKEVRSGHGGLRKYQLCFLPSSLLPIFVQRSLPHPASLQCCCQALEYEVRDSRLETGKSLARVSFKLPQCFRRRI